MKNAEQHRVDKTPFLKPDVRPLRPFLGPNQLTTRKPLPRMLMMSPKNFSENATLSVCQFFLTSESQVLESDGFCRSDPQAMKGFIGKSQDPTL